MQITAKSKILTILGFGPTGDLGPLTGYTSKRGKPVWFLKAPPKTPASPWQRRERNRFKLISTLWKSLSPQKRSDWRAAPMAARLTITGYNLFVWYQYSRDDAVIHTIEHQSGITLLPLF